MSPSWWQFFYTQLITILNWKIICIISQIRPDICFSANSLPTNFKNANFSDIKYLNKTISHAKQPNVSVKFKQLRDIYNLKIVLYADAMHWNLGGASQERHYFSWSISFDWCCWKPSILIANLFKLLHNTTYWIPMETVTDNKLFYHTLRSTEIISRQKTWNYLQADIALLK